MNFDSKRLATIVAMLTLLAACVYAQSTSGDLVGTVYDSTGAVIPNAAVTATNVATGIQHSASVTSSGQYRLGNLPVGSGTLGEARLASRYLSKYVGKDLGRTVGSGLHRYEVAQGFQPRGVQLDGHSADEVLGWAETYMGAAPERVWRSRDEEGWDRPPAVWASWS